MKAIIKFLFLFIVIPLLTACGSGDNSRQSLNENNETEKKKGQENKMSNILVKLKFANEEVMVRMEDTPVAQDFLSLLPMKFIIEDYAGTEKVSYLPRKLSTENAPKGIEAKRGDFNYYAPWGNLAIFYEDFRFSNGLIKLGTIESGIEKLENIRDNFEMVIEKAE
ncbi:cyclophilin-like fold protein [Bacillus cereus]|uniref:cyclophilin-like fold protein n=1 Tax=Bacillus cereus group TaxID=86661 RepID=UPI0001A00966|nr:cyclophilin-like fold protein [Bacillus cereus]EEK78279.1 hypothetical protein bcere0009_28020 [Bacillus cereus R309803]